MNHTERTVLSRTMRSRLVGVAIALVVMVCVVLIEALHDHDCTGDGCVLCLVLGGAYVLLGLCFGVVVAHPALRVFLGTRFVSIRKRHVLHMGAFSLDSARCAIAAQTPFSLRVLIRV